MLKKYKQLTIDCAIFDIIQFFLRNTSSCTSLPSTSKCWNFSTTVSFSCLILPFRKPPFTLRNRCSGCKSSGGQPPACSSELAPQLNSQRLVSLRCVTYCQCLSPLQIKTLSNRFRKLRIS